MEEKIRLIPSEEISEAVRRLFLSAAVELPAFASGRLKEAESAETSPVGREILGTLSQNLDAALKCGVPICQDTGMAVVFADFGRGAAVSGKSFTDAVNEGVRRAYVDGALRLSVVEDPLYERKNTGDNTPAVIHVRFTDDPDLAGKIRLTAAPKGFGSENMSAIRMFTPSANEDDVTEFVVGVAASAGANPCPPIYVGVGIGGDFESCALLSKRALLRESASDDERYARLERRLLSEINRLGIGPQGFGGDVTALAVFIEHAPTHIAGLPVAVNICCHVNRHASAVI